jgi:hypothetical protein
MKSVVTCRHHAIYIKDERTLPKVDSHMLACLFHAHRRIKFALDLAEGSTLVVLVMTNFDERGFL